jgi:Flp pilus assembly protein TadD
MIREALEAHYESSSTAYREIGYLQTMLGTVQMKEGRFADAEQTLHAALELFGK